MFGKDYASILRDEQPIVIMSRGHSGTRVLSWSLDKLGVKMGTLSENPAADTQFLKLTGSIKKIAGRHLHEPARSEPSKSDLRLFQKRMVQYLEWLGDRKPYWGWKFPETYLIGNYVEATFPKARYIHMIRDGRDIAFKTHSTDRPRKLGKIVLNHLNALDKPQHLRSALSWQFQVNRWDEFEAGLDAPVYTLTFEELLQKPVETIEKLCASLDIPMNDECRSYLETGVNAKKLGQYKGEDPEKVREVEEQIRETLNNWGYQVD
ncbi:sulfotransferase [bacterium]|nr:sulfotransferase [bacterium]